MRSAVLTDFLRRVCDHLGIAFTANRVFPSLADISQYQEVAELNEELNAVGKHFGIRFRPLKGNLRELVHSVNDSGPVLVSTRPDSDDQTDGLILVLESKSRGRILIHRNGEDRTVTNRWLKKQLAVDDENQFNWLLIQPVYASERASRIHYHGGTVGSLNPASPFVRNASARLQRYPDDPDIFGRDRNP